MGLTVSLLISLSPESPCFSRSLTPSVARTRKKEQEYKKKIEEGRKVREIGKEERRREGRVRELKKESDRRGRRATDREGEREKILIKKS
jgi:hypothetical protein